MDENIRVEMKVDADYDQVEDVRRRIAEMKTTLPDPGIEIASAPVIGMVAAIGLMTAIFIGGLFVAHYIIHNFF